MAGELVAQAMPRLLLDPRRYALEEAVPAPTDITSQKPGCQQGDLQRTGDH